VIAGNLRSHRYGLGRKTEKGAKAQHGLRIYFFRADIPFNTTIITPKIYEASSKLKKPGKRFSGAVLGLVRGISGILELTGAWSDVGEERGRGLL